MKDALSELEAFERALTVQKQSCGIPWCCAICGASGLINADNCMTVLNLLFATREQHQGAAPQCTAAAGQALIVPALVLRRVR